MLGVSRVGYRWPPTARSPAPLGACIPRWGTPYVIMGLAAVAAAALVLPTDLELLIGIYAFGALLSFTIAHVSIIVLRYRDPKRPRGYKVPFSVRIAGGNVPIPPCWGRCCHSPAGSRSWRSSGRPVRGPRLAAGGPCSMSIYRKSESKPLLKRVTIPERALRHEALEPDFGSILVPIFGSRLDDDIVQTAGRLAGEDRDGPGPGRSADRGRVGVRTAAGAAPGRAVARGPGGEGPVALARAKAVGEEYGGVTVATTVIRARRAGQAIVSEATKRGVEAIVLAAEEPSRIRGGGLFGGSGGPLDNYLGEISKYVIRKAPCRVIITAPANRQNVPDKPVDSVEDIISPAPAPDREETVGEASGTVKTTGAKAGH